MRSKVLLSILLLFFIFIFPVPVNAQPTALQNILKLEDSRIMRKEASGGAKAASDAAKAKREEFKQRLKTIHDENKMAHVERIDVKISNVNQKATTRFMAVLEKLQSILNRIIGKALNRIIGKAKDFKTDGVDTTSLDSATTSAQKAIDAAKTAVASQAANLYVIQIASESALKVNVGLTVSQLRRDLRDVHKAVVAAKQAVQRAVRELALLNKFKKSVIIKTDKNANLNSSPSASPTISASPTATSSSK